MPNHDEQNIRTIRIKKKQEGTLDFLYQIYETSKSKLSHFPWRRQAFKIIPWMELFIGLPQSLMLSFFYFELNHLNVIKVVVLCGGSSLLM